MKKFLICLLYFSFCISCTPEIKPIEFGHDTCFFCKMRIADKRYGAELITQKGKVYKYDAIECLIYSVFENKVVEKPEIHSLHVINFNLPTQFINSDSSLYLRSKNLHSPMGKFLSAFANQQEVFLAQKDFNGDILTWKETVEYVLHSE